MQNLEYIRNHYGVPAELGRRVEYTGDKTPKQGVIVGVTNHYISIHFDGDKKPTKRFHPTWEIKYLGMGVVPKIKQTRSQARYQRYLSTDCFDNFMQFCYYEQDEKNARKCGFSSVGEYRKWLCSL